MEENCNGNGKWRQEIRNLNINYLNLVKHLGAMPEGSGYAQTMLGLDIDRFNLLVGLDSKTLRLMADVRVLLFRPRLSDLTSVSKLCKKGSVDRANSILAAALTASDAAKEEEA